MSYDDRSGIMPFDSYLRSRNCQAAPSAIAALDCIALAKRILMQEKVRDFTSADVVALAGIIEQRDRASRP